MSAVLSVKRRNGVAGQFELEARVRYADEDPRTVGFVGSTYGGPVVLVMPNGLQVFVTDPGRFGEKLDEAWVRAFFAAD